MFFCETLFSRVLERIHFGLIKVLNLVAFFGLSIHWIVAPFYFPGLFVLNSPILVSIVIGITSFGIQSFGWSGTVHVFFQFSCFCSCLFFHFGFRFRYCFVLFVPSFLFCSYAQFANHSNFPIEETVHIRELAILQFPFCICAFKFTLL